MPEGFFYFWNTIIDVLPAMPANGHNDNFYMIEKGPFYGMSLLLPSSVPCPNVRYSIIVLLFFPDMPANGHNDNFYMIEKGPFYGMSLLR